MPELKHPYPIPEAGIEDDAVTVDKIKDGEITNAKIAAAAAIAYSKLATDPRIARIKTGTFTGDGSTSQAITGIGFQPKVVIIYENPTSLGDSFVDANLHIKNDQDTGQISFVGTGSVHRVLNDRLISIDSDGFTVDDAAGDASPNKNNDSYGYICFG